MNDTATTPELGEATFRRTYDAPAALVFECMTTPEHLQHFWGPTGMSTPLANIVVEPRVGGRFETTMVMDEGGMEFAMKGVFTIFEPPTRLAWTEQDVEGGMTTTVTFVDLGDGRTEAVTHQTNVPAQYLTEESRTGMATSFDRFAAYLATL